MKLNLFLFILLSCITGGSVWADEMPRFYGLWVGAGAPSSITFKSPGMYTLDTDQDGKPEIEGTFLLEGNVIVLRDTSSVVAPNSVRAAGCEDAYGVYRYRLTEGALILSVIKETCPTRAAVLSREWKKNG